MSLILSPVRNIGKRFPDLELGPKFRVDSDAEVLNGRKTLKDVTDRSYLDRPNPTRGNYVDSDDRLDPVLRHHLRR